MNGLFKRILGRLVHPGVVAALDSRVSIHRDAILLPAANFRFAGRGGAVRVDAESMIGCSFVFESEVGRIEIGQRSYVSPGTQMISRSAITIGSDVTIAWGCVFYDHNSHSLDWRERANDIRRQNAAHRHGKNFIADKNWDVVKAAPIVVRDKAWIGFDSVILKGVSIGEGAVVGACSVVREDVPAWTVVAGNPAVPISRIDPDRREKYHSAMNSDTPEWAGSK